MKIVVGIDFTDSAVQVANRAKRLADSVRGELRLLHVIESVEDPEGDPEIRALYQELHAKSQQRLRSEEARLGLSVDSSVVSIGSRHEALLEMAQKLGAELLVLGSRPLTGQRTRVGIGHRVACCATVPTLLVPLVEL